ncbi:MAG: acyltransferase [Ruminococcus sp.]|nr:acyltransferase [Ruminococcus sp.]
MTINQKNFIEKDATNVLKGFALILMFVHHFFTFPDWYVDGVSYPYLLDFAEYMQGPSKICVPIFAFLTGYFYYYSKEKNMRYSARKITDVWFTYLIVFLVLLVPAVLFSVYEFTLENLVLEILGLYTPTMFFCWYVIFYITTMLVLPLYAKISERCCAFILMVLSVIPTMIYYTLQPVLTGLASNLLTFAVSFVFFPCVGIGFIFAKYGLFFEFNNIIKTKNKALIILIGLGLIVLSMFPRLKFFDPGIEYNLPVSDAVCATFFIFAVLLIYYNTSHKAIYKPIAIIGKYSLIMWFVHSLFFNQCKEFTQPFLYLPKQPILVLLWGLLICFVISFVLQIPINYILKLKDKAFKLS